MDNTFVLHDRFKAKDLIKLTKIELIDMLLNTRERLREANINLATARVTIADHQRSIVSKRRALQRNSKTVRSLRNTVKRRRKVHHG